MRFTASGPTVAQEDGSDDEAQMRYVLEPTDDCQLRLQRYIRVCDHIDQSVGKAPRTLSDYNEKMKLACSPIASDPADADSRPLKAPHLSGEYMLPWHVRCWLLCRMHQSDVKKLRVDDEIALNAFVRMNPDMSGHMVRLRAHCSSVQQQSASVPDFLEGIGSTGRPELISMWLCFTSDPGLRDSDFESFDAEAWRSAAAEYVELHQVVPHPAVLCLHLCHCFVCGLKSKYDVPILLVCLH